MARRAGAGWISTWPRVPPAALLGRKPRTPPFPLGDPRFRSYLKARHGLFEGARALGLGEGTTVLAPAYQHGSEIEALIRTGATVAFYRAGDALEPDPDELDSLLNPQVRALYLVHYLGFLQDLRRWRAWCDERGLLLIEDSAQAWLSEREGLASGSVGDLSIFCFYKTAGLGQPAGLFCTSPPEAPSGSRVGAAASLAKANLDWISRRGALPRLGGDRHVRVAAEAPADEFELGDVTRRPSKLAEAVRDRVVADIVRERRRRNYAALLEGLAEHVPAPFRTLPEGVCPLQLPVWADDKRRCLERLASHGVEGGDAWPFRHPILASGRFPEADAWRESVVWLPVHQELRAGDLGRIVAAAREALRGAAADGTGPR
jgi:hypothetical protein